MRLFFREEDLSDMDAQAGPKGAQGVPLTPMRSIAVDRQSIPYGTPVWMTTTGPTFKSARLVMAQDTGGAIVGAGLAFLWFNAPPAAVFMGDTGSLALGGTLGAIAVVAHHEFVLAVIGGLFVAEALSVIIQVFWFKRTGKRVFRMAPIHHHFEQLGWSEPTVVIRFWIIAFVLALAGLSTLKLR